MTKNERKREKDVWGNGGYRVFLSHKAGVKRKTSTLKDQLAMFGVAGFVAHKDIRPTKAWQDEIEHALSTMDAFVALLTKQFHESDWTDQEIGFAFARRVPIIAVRMGQDPYGFIGRFQGLTCKWNTAASEIVKLLISQDGMLKSYIQAVENCGCYDDGNELAEVLVAIEELSDKRADALIRAYNENGQVNCSYGFDGSKPRYYGNGLLFHLRRLTKRSYKESSVSKIKVLN